MLKKLNNNLLLGKPKAVLFDTDNTLYEYEIANTQANKAVYLKAKNLLGVDESTFCELYTQARKTIKAQLGETASSHSRLLYYQRILEYLGLKAQLLIALDLEQTFWRTFLANAPLFPYVLETLSLLTQHSIPIAIVTDLTSHIQLRKLTYFGLETTFDAVVTSEEVGADKPDIRNFTLVQNKLGLSTSENVWMVGDNAYTDIFGANRYGAITFQKIHRAVQIGLDSSSPDYIFNDFKDLYDLIDCLFEKAR